MSLFVSKYYKSGNPQKLVIFVHGYNGTPAAIHYAVEMLLTHLKDAVIVVPQAPFPCEKDKKNLQWLSFYEEDPLVRFRNPEASVEEIFDIFNRLGHRFAEVSSQMNTFIDEQQTLWKIDEADTYLIGFSQGAMISLYTALTRKQPLGGCISVAGIIAGKDLLEKQISSKPKLLLLHGKEDATVQYKTVASTKQWLTDHHIPFDYAEFEGLAHRMNEAEMKKAADFINSEGKNLPSA